MYIFDWQKLHKNEIKRNKDVTDDILKIFGEIPVYGRSYLNKTITSKTLIGYMVFGLSAYLGSQILGGIYQDHPENSEQAIIDVRFEDLVRISYLPILSSYQLCNTPEQFEQNCEWMFQVTIYILRKLGIDVSTFSPEEKLMGHRISHIFYDDMTSATYRQIVEFKYRSIWIRVNSESEVLGSDGNNDVKSAKQESSTWNPDQDQSFC